MRIINKGWVRYTIGLSFETSEITSHNHIKNITHSVINHAIHSLKKNHLNLMIEIYL